MRKNDDCIAIYSRKSKYTGKGESIGNQIELCREYIRTHYGDSEADKAIVFEDEGFSGGNLNRPDFKRMMEAAKKRKFKAIIVYRLDRISRNISDFSGLIEELSRLEIDFISIREQFDTGTPMGRAMMYIASVFSQLERETIAERIRDNMHELAKTGIWLGGNTPTGYASESTQTVTVDGKTKKAHHLKLIPKEAEVISLIFQTFQETGSLTKTDAELLRRGITTKQGNNYTRFAIRNILQNPVYMIADEDAWEYLNRNEADLFSDKSKFDGIHGIMAYNRTIQEKGKAIVYRPVSEWIVAVGKHPGLVPGRVWVQIQDALAQNKSKAYRKPRNNEALLTGLLFCCCGSRMYPKLSKRMTADGDPIYTYVCKMKERSKKEVCNNHNANGNTLDLAIVEQIKSLDDASTTFIDQLEKSRTFYTGNRVSYEEQLEAMEKEKAEVDRKMEGLIDSLAEMGDTSIRGNITKRIEQLNLQSQDMESRIRELHDLTSQHALSDIEFDVLRQLLSVFRNGIDEMTVEQKRAAIRTLVRKIIWDGTNAHVIMFGASEDEIEYPDISALYQDSDDEEDESDTLEPFADVDYEDEDAGDYDTGSKTLLCEDSK